MIQLRLSLSANSKVKTIIEVKEVKPTYKSNFLWPQLMRQISDPLIVFLKRERIFQRLRIHRTNILAVISYDFGYKDKGVKYSILSNDTLTIKVITDEFDRYKETFRKQCVEHIGFEDLIVSSR